MGRSVGLPGTSLLFLDINTPTLLSISGLRPGLPHGGLTVIPDLVVLLFRLPIDFP